MAIELIHDIDKLQYQCLLNFRKEMNLPPESIVKPTIQISQPPKIDKPRYRKKNRILTHESSKNTKELKLWEFKLFQAIRWKNAYRREPLYYPDIEGEVYLFFLHNRINYNSGRMKNLEMRILYEKHVILGNEFQMILITLKTDHIILYHYQIFPMLN